MSIARYLRLDDDVDQAVADLMEHTGWSRATAVDRLLRRGLSLHDGRPLGDAGSAERLAQAATYAYALLDKALYGGPVRVCFQCRADLAQCNATGCGGRHAPGWREARTDEQEQASGAVSG